MSTIYIYFKFFKGFICQVETKNVFVRQKMSKTAEKLSIKVLLKNKHIAQKFLEIKNQLGVTNNTEVLRFLISEYYRMAQGIPREQTVLYNQEAQTLLNSLHRVKQLIHHYQPEESRWLARAIRELNKWIRRLKFVLRVRT